MTPTVSTKCLKIVMHLLFGMAAILNFWPIFKTWGFDFLPVTSVWSQLNMGPVKDPQNCYGFLFTTTEN